MISKRVVFGVAASMVTALAVTAPVSAQAMGSMKGVSLEARGGFNVPTFKIADVAKAGPSFGVGVGVVVAPRVWLLADGDFGYHGGKAGGPDVHVYHYIGKVGYDVLQPGSSRWSVLVNAGAGALTFDVQAPGAQAKTYFAINVGAKIGYQLTDGVALLLSPQGDIAFTDKTVLGTNNSWVWPFSAGLRFRF
jgi:hypothetical protein